MKKYLLPFLFLSFIVACQNNDDTGPVEQPPAPNPIEIDSLIDSIFFEINPFGNVPLTAQINLNTNEEVTVEATVLGNIPINFKEENFAINHDIYLYGLYADTTNLIKIKATDKKGDFQLDTIQITTEPLPEILPEIEIITSLTSQREKRFTFSMYEVRVGANSYSYPIIFDDEGNIRWYMSLDYISNLAAPGEVLSNGNLIYGFGNFVCEFNLMGYEVNRFQYPGFFQHHDVYEKPDGNLLIAVTKNNIETFNDHIIELDINSGNIIREWDLRQSLDQNRTAFTGSSSDWAHVNSIQYDEIRDNIIVSARTQGIACVSMENELVWILAPHEAWGISGNGTDCNDFLLTAIDESGSPYDEEIQLGEVNHPSFGWTYGQHAAEVLSNGNVIAFDNGHRRNFSSSGEEYSRGVEYKIDLENKTVRQVWEYGRERGSELFSKFEGDIDVIPENNNRLISPAKIELGNGFSARVVEVTYPHNLVVFEAYLKFPILLNSRGTGVYRSERIAL